MKLNNLPHFALTLCFIAGVVIFLFGCIALSALCCWQLAVLVGGLLLSILSFGLYMVLYPGNQDRG